MKAEHVARRPVVTASPDATIKEVGRIMAQRRIGLVVIVDPEDPETAVGVVSERDIVRAVAEEVDLDKPVSEIMSRPVVSVDVEEPLWAVARVMKQNNIRHVVVTQGGKLYGVISIRDIVGEDEAMKSLLETVEKSGVHTAAD